MEPGDAMTKLFISGNIYLTDDDIGNKTKKRLSRTILQIA